MPDNPFARKFSQTVVGKRAVQVKKVQRERQERRKQTQPKPKTYKPGQMIQKSYEQQREVEQRQEVQQKEIQSVSRLIAGAPPEQRTILLAQRGEMERRYKQLGQSSIRLQKQYQFWQKGTREWHPETKVVETEKGYRIVEPYPGASEVYRAKKEARKQSPGVMTVRTLYVAATQFPSVYYNIATGKSAKKWQREMIISESRTWGAGKRGDVGYVAKETLTSPTMQEVYFVGASYGISKVIKWGAPHVAKGIIKAGGKVASKYPTIGKVAQPIIKTDVGKNVYRYAMKGYRKGQLMVESPIGKPFYKQGVRYQKFVYKPGKKVWMSSKEVTRFESRVATSGRVSMDFPRFYGEAGVGEVRFTMVGEKFGKDFFGRTTRTSIGRTAYKNIGTDIGLYRVTTKTVRTPTTVYTPQTFEKLGYQKSVQEMYKTGYPYKTTMLESGKRIVDYTPGMGTYKPQPKPWVTKMKIGKQASVSLVKPVRPSFKMPSRSIRLGRVGEVRPSLVFPTRTTFFIPFRVTTPKVAYQSISVSMYERKTDVVPVSVTSVKTIGQQRYIGTTKTVTPVQAQKTVTTTVVQPATTYRSITTPSVTIPTVKTGISPYPTQKIPFIYPKGVYGRGKRTGDFSLFGKKYKFRAVKIPDPFKGGL